MDKLFKTQYVLPHCFQTSAGYSQEFSVLYFLGCFADNWVRSRSLAQADPGKMMIL